MFLQLTEIATDPEVHLLVVENCVVFFFLVAVVVEAGVVVHLLAIRVHFHVTVAHLVVFLPIAVFFLH